MIDISELPAHWQIWYQQWDTSVPESEKKQRLRGELLGEVGSQQSYSAAFDLFLFSMFNNMELKVDFQPEINGVNPDFCISDKRGCSAYVEAGAMFSDPIQTELSYMSMAMPIWEEFKKLESKDFSVQFASSSGHPGNVSPKSVRRKVQQWIDELDTAEVIRQHYYGILPYETFQFKNWSLDLELKLKSCEEKERLGAKAVSSDLAGFSGRYSDDPAGRLKSKLKEKSSQVRKTRSHCIVAITERLDGFQVEDIQTALLGGHSEYSFSRLARYGPPHLKDLSIPQPNNDGLWSPHEVKEPFAAIVHRGDLQNSSYGEAELWLNPNSSYFDVPFPLYSLKISATQQKIWTRPTPKL